MALKSLHDRLLAERPDGAEHDETKCPLCAMENHDDALEGGSMSEITQADLDAAVESAVKAATEKLEAEIVTPLQTKLAELEAAAEETEVGKAIAEATAPLEQKISEMQAQLDEATVAQAAAEKAKTDLETFLAEAAADAERAVELEAKKEERLEEIKDFELPEDFVTANADRFAAMSDDDWAARLDEWKVIASKATDGKIPQRTALVASREGEGGKGSNNGSKLGELASLRRSLTDPRTL